MPEQTPATYPSDAWWRNALQHGAELVDAQHFVKNGRLVEGPESANWTKSTWANLAMNAAAGKSLELSRWETERSDSAPLAEARSEGVQTSNWHEVDYRVPQVSRAFVDRLGAEYGQARHWSQADYDLGRVEATLANGPANETLDRAAAKVVDLENSRNSLGADRDSTVRSVRDAMVDAMTTVRDQPSPPGTDGRDFGARLGSAAADAGIKAARRITQHAGLQRDVAAVLGANPPLRNPQAGGLGDSAARPNTQHGSVQRKQGGPQIQ